MSCRHDVPVPAIDVRAFFETRYTAEELEQLSRLLGRLPGAGTAVEEDCTA